MFHITMSLIPSFSPYPSLELSKSFRNSFPRTCPLIFCLAKLSLLKFHFLIVEITLVLYVFRHFWYPSQYFVTIPTPPVPLARRMSR